MTNCGYKESHRNFVSKAAPQATRSDSTDSRESVCHPRVTGMSLSFGHRGCGCDPAFG